MAYCIKCGKQNPDTAKFCTGCGGALVAKQETTPAANYPKESAPTKGKKINWVIFASLGTLLLAAAVYFIFLNKEKSKDNPVVDNDEQQNTTESTIPVATDSDPVPLKPGTQNTELTISQTEVDNVSRRIDEFYQYETKEDIPNLLSYYRFPLDRYYQLYNVSYSKLHKMVAEAFNGKLYYHSINIKWSYSSVQKLSSGGYKALLFAEYTSASQSGDDRKTQNIHLTIIMNNNYEITSIFPN